MIAYRAILPQNANSDQREIGYFRRFAKMYTRENIYVHSRWARYYYMHDVLMSTCQYTQMPHSVHHICFYSDRDIYATLVLNSCYVHVNLKYF